MRGSARGSVVLLIGQIITAILSTLTIIWMARYLGSESYGLYIIALLPVSIALLFQDFGMNTFLMRFCSLYRHEDKKDELKSGVITGLVFSIATALLISVVLFILAESISSEFLKRPEVAPLVRTAAFAILGGGGFADYYTSDSGRLRDDGVKEPNTGDLGLR